MFSCNFSHFDGVRSLAFHPYASALITGSEDNTLKLWSLQRNSQMKKFVFFFSCFNFLATVKLLVFLFLQEIKI